MTTRKFLAALLIAVVSLPFYAYGYTKPTAEIRRFQVEEISLRNVTFLFELAVKNPYPVALSFSGLTLDFSVEGSKVFSTRSKGGFKVGARSETSNVFTATLEYDDIIKLVKDYASREWLDTVIDGELVIPLPAIPGLPKEMWFSYKLEKKIPAIKPRVAIVGFTVSPPSAEQVARAITAAGKRADPVMARRALTDVLAGKKPTAPVVDPSELDVPLSVKFAIEIQNEAKGPISFEKLGYELFMNGERLVVGESSDVIREGNKILVEVSNTFSSKRLSESVRALFSERKGSFEVKGTAAVKLPDEIRKEPVPLVFDESGTFTLK